MSQRDSERPGEPGNFRLKTYIWTFFHVPQAVPVQYNLPIYLDVSGD